MSERFKLITEGLDVAPLLSKLAANPALWTEHIERQTYPGSAHAATETIYLRWATDQSPAGGFYCLESEDLLESLLDLTPEIGPLFQSVLRHIGCGEQPEVGRVILVKLAPHGHIAEHVNEGPYADRYERFHVCLSGTSSFYVEGEQQEMKPGELWWFNHKKAHKVHNFSHQPRIHLIIDLVAPEYRKLRGLTFQRERALDLWEEIMPLLIKHKDEICHYKDFVLNPDVESYNHLEENGIIRCYTARLNGDLIGYCVFVLKHNLHYRDSFQAMQDVLFILPEHRGSRAGVKLIRFCEEQLRAEGVQAVFQYLNVSTPKTISLFRKMGYEEINVIMGKRLDHCAGTCMEAEPMKTEFPQCTFTKFDDLSEERKKDFHLLPTGELIYIGHNSILDDLPMTKADQ